MFAQVPVHDQGVADSAALDADGGDSDILQRIFGRRVIGIQHLTDNIRVSLQHGRGGTTDRGVRPLVDVLTDFRHQVALGEPVGGSVKMRNAGRNREPAPFSGLLELHAQADVLRDVLSRVAWTALLRRPPPLR